VQFQRAPVPETSRNGLVVEALLAIFAARI
jgi:hypothetical protein